MLTRGINASDESLLGPNKKTFLSQLPQAPPSAHAQSAGPRGGFPPLRLSGSDKTIKTPHLQTNVRAQINIMCLGDCFYAYFTLLDGT